MNNKYYTKSAHKLALECPTRLYYCCDDRYANQNDDNEFMQSLAQGGFQIGELAKIYYHIDDRTTVGSVDYSESLADTERFLQEKEINIAEAAFKYKRFFVRADILEKRGDVINLIEVKAKSFDSSNGTTITKENLQSDLKPYIQDVAFQKYVVEKSLQSQHPNRHYTIRAYLMMADKYIQAPVNGMNRYFKITKDNKIAVLPGAEDLANYPHILTAFDVDDLCNAIIGADSYVSSIEQYADAFCSHIKISAELSHKCFKCPFYSLDGRKKDGFKECWKEKAGLTDEDLERPLLKDFSMSGFWQMADRLIKQGKYRMSELAPEDIATRSGEMEMRRIIQLGLSLGDETIVKEYGDSIKEGKYFLDIDGLKEEMKEWRFPLHFIDFETSAAALPFYKGMRPYEDIAFQFSHHTVKMRKDGSYVIEHSGQYLNTKKMQFPNFVFIRKLREELDKDEGTVFRYANHENKILRSIRRQLLESSEADRDELVAFIDTITHSGEKEQIKHQGKRDMKDLEATVKKYFMFPRYMKGRTSIKVVLPAVLNASRFLQEKYSRPIYGTEIKSQNYKGDIPPVSWVKQEPGKMGFTDPYHELEKIEKEILTLSGFTEADYDAIKEEIGDTVANGGAALTAYSRLQYTDMVATKVLENALYRYCELDTMAMVFIWEFFHEMTCT